MTQQKQPLDYRSGPEDDTGTRDRAASAAVAAALIIAIMNGLVLALEAANPGLGALAIALTISPIANGSVVIIGLAISPLIKKRSASASTLLYLLVEIVIPVGAAIFDIKMAHDMR